MANFATDQVRQLYVVKDKATTFDPMPGDGFIRVDSSPDDLWLTYQTPNGDQTVNGTSSVTRSDLINKDKIVSAHATGAFQRPLKKVEVEFDPTINGGLPVVGQEYLLRFTFFGIGIGGPENQYIKNGGATRVRAGQTAADVYELIVELVKKNFSREAFPYVKVTTDTYDPYTMTTKPGTSTKIIIEEVLQPWVLGKRQAAQVDFNVNTVVINYNGGEYPWGEITDVTAANTNVLLNGRVTADMEYFYLGERGDTFRGMGFPDNFEAKYLIDPTKEYEFIELAYYYAGDTEDVQKSKKHITLAFEKGGTYTALAAIADFASAGVTVVNNI